MKTVLFSATCLCALLLLTACGLDRRPLVRTELVEVPTVLYAPLPAVLTDPLAAPPPPPFNCRLPSGQATFCALDGLLREEQWLGLLDRANDDRESAARISRDASLKAGDDRP